MFINNGKAWVSEWVSEWLIDVLSQFSHFSAISLQEKYEGVAYSLWNDSLMASTNSLAEMAVVEVWYLESFTRILILYLIVMVFNLIDIDVTKGHILAPPLFYVIFVLTCLLVNKEDILLAKRYTYLFWDCFDILHSS